MSGLSVPEMRQAAGIHIDDILSLAKPRTQEVSFPIERSKRHGTMLLEAMRVFRADGADGMAENVYTLSIGEAGSLPVASVSVDTVSGLVRYTLQDPFKLRDLAESDMPLNNGLINPRWFMEPLDPEAKGFELVSDFPKRLDVKKSPAMIYEVDEDQAGIAAYITDIAGDVLQRELVHTTITREITADNSAYSLSARRTSHTRPVHDAPYREITHLSYEDKVKELKLGVKAVRPNAELGVNGQLQVEVALPPRYGHQTSFGFDTRYTIKSDANDEPYIEEATQDFNHPSPIGGPTVEKPVEAALKLLNEHLAGAALEMHFMPDLAFD